MQQTVMILGVIGILAIAIVIAGLTSVQCIKSLVDSNGVIHTYPITCSDIVPPTYVPPGEGGFFQTVGNIFSFLSDNVSWLFSITTTGLAINGYILSILILLLVSLIVFTILKLLSLGGGG